MEEGERGGGGLEERAGRIGCRSLDSELGATEVQRHGPLRPCSGALAAALCLGESRLT